MTALSGDGSFTWTATGVCLSRDGLTITADHLDQYGQRARVNVYWQGELCYRERTNLDDPRHRQTFVRKLLLAGKQAGMTGKTAPLRRIKSTVTAACLIRLGAACRTWSKKPLTSPGADQARRAAAEQAAGDLLDDPGVLSRIGAAMRANGYAGDLEPAQLAYVALTSRCLDRPINLVFVGDPAAGKNATIDAALALVPPEEVYVFHASSPTSIVYTDGDFEHRVVVFKEADSIPDDGPAASAIRALAEGNQLLYEVTTFNPISGRVETRTIDKKGPTGLITTSVRALRRQLNTRVLPVRLPVRRADDVDRRTQEIWTTREVIRSKGERAAGRTPRPGAPAPFLALQEWLALAENPRVIVPFAEVLAALMPTDTMELRTRRDFEQLLSCVKTIAFLRQCQRPRTRDGEIVAAIDDYRLARNLLVASFEAAAADGLTVVIRQTVEAIEPWETTGVSVTELAARLEVSKSVASWRAAKALKMGYLVNRAPGRPYRLKRGRALPELAPVLPDADYVETWALEGVPDPVLNRRFLSFASDITKVWPAGITAVELAAMPNALNVKTDPEWVRRRLDMLVAAGLLVRDDLTDRHAVLFWVPELVLWGDW